MSTDKESSAAGTNNRPSMLVESDYESWKIRIERYIHGKPLGKLIWISIQIGPTPHPQITVTEGQGVVAVQVTRDKTDKEFTEIENNRELADIQATKILSQGLLRHVFNIINQTRTGKEIWDNVELLMKGSGKSLQQKKEELFDEYERFRAIGNEPIYDYFVRFHKLINDMKITQLDIPAHQMNTKFVNNLPPYFAKYVTNVKNDKDISATTYVELYTYLKSYEPHAMKTLKKKEHNDAMLATMNQIVNLLSGFQKQFPPTNNQLRTSSNSRSHVTVHDGQIVTKTVQRKAPSNVGNTCTRETQSYGQVTDNKGKLVICYNCRGERHVSRQCKEKKRVKDSQYFKDKMLLMEAKEKGAVLDAEAKAFLADVECTTPYDQPLAITTINNFEVSHEDVYNSDVDEGPHATAAFMANLSSTSGTNGATTSHVNEVHTDNNQIFVNVNHLLAHEMHQEEHLDSDVESDIDENTIPYHQYQLDSEVQDVPTEVSSVSPGEISMITILDDLRNQLDGHLKVNHEQSMVNYSLRAELARWTIKPINYAKLNALYSHFVPQKELSREQVYWLPAEELATQKSNPPKPMTPFVYTFLASSKAPSEEPSSNCVREYSKVIELEAEILKQQQMLAESDKQWKDDTIRKLHTQINNMSMLNVEPTVGSLDKQALETELTHLKDAITSVRIQNDGFKITALTVENAKLKSETLSKMHSKPIVPEKPKVLAPGMYAISFKYIVLQRRVNRAEPTHLPKKKQATF
nr:hypothetical protein [Tanacetum cinerariifolium]